MVNLKLSGIMFALLYAQTDQSVELSRAMPLSGVSFEEAFDAGAAGTGCAWKYIQSETAEISMKADRGVVKLDGSIIRLRPAEAAQELFPFTYDRWTDGSIEIAIYKTGQSKLMLPETIETPARLELMKDEKSMSWAGTLYCGS